ncbi:MAG: hypothetical protein H7Y61_18385 [Rhizobiales bacterium]|nr:hypothetical protein [Rhizobacter sp.]
MFAARVVKGLRSRSPAEITFLLKVLLRNAVGLPNPIVTPDRETLEQIILPAYARRDDIRTVVFVGCDWYTRHYEKLFQGKSYWTLDPDRWKRRFGARRHLVIGMEQIDEHFAPGSIDLIVCNGVFGWGLNERAAVERAFEGSFSRLREGGHFVLGWNDVPERRPLELDSLVSLARFRPESFAGLGTAHHVSTPGTGHTFDFYVKPGAQP